HACLRDYVVIAVRRHQNLTAQPGTICQIEFRPILEAAASFRDSLFIDAQNFFIDAKTFFAEPMQFPTPDDALHVGQALPADRSACLTPDKTTPRSIRSARQRAAP